MLLEAKDPWAFPGIEQDIDKELRSIPAFSKALAAGRVLMQAGDQPWLRAYHDLAPDVPVALLHYARPDRRGAGRRQPLARRRSTRPSAT